MQLPFGIQQSTLAGGLSGLAAWGIGLGLAALGVTVPAGVITGAIAILIPVVVHFVPDAAKVDAEIKTIAAELPQAYSSPADLNDPGAPLSTSPDDENINKG
jgi:hypothetical protein